MTGNYYTLSAFFVLSILLASCASSGKAPAQSEARRYSDEQDGRFDNETESRMIAYSISLEITIKNPDETRTKIIEQVKNFNGFIIQESNSYINARIPSEAADNFVNIIKTLGKINYESKTGTDITDKYHDNLVRLDNLKTVRDRYLALLEKAVSVQDILGIEKELERVNTEIDIIEGRIKYAEQSVAYSNIFIRYRERTKPGPIGWIFYGMYLGIKWLFVWN